MGHKKNKYHHRVPSSTKSENGSDNKKKPKPYQPRIESNEELIHQMLQVEQLLSVSHEKLNKAEHHCYLLSTAWLHSWKEYTGYFDYQRGLDPQKAFLFGQCRPEPANSDIISKGPSNYIEIPKSMEEYNYLSVEVDASMELNKDFRLVDADLWYFFEAKYTGKKILRPIKRTKGKPTRFDVELAEIRFVALKNETMLQFQQLEEEVWKNSYEDLVPIHRLQVPSFWTMRDLRQFTNRYLREAMKFDGEPTDIEFLKFESFISDRDIKISMIQTIRKANFNFLGRALDEEEKLEYEIADFLKSSHVLLIRFGAVKFNRIPLKKFPVLGNCEFCLTKHQLEVMCGCKRVLYCSRKCAAEDKAFHQRICQLAYESDDDEQYEFKEVTTSFRNCGLSNLGNTCYMNSALQCLANISPFCQYFLQNIYKGSMDKKQLELHRGIFMKKIAKMLKKYQQQELLTPWSLKTQVNHFIPQFRGYDQHDSSEFLMALLNIINDQLEKENKEQGYSRLLCDTFLGWFESKIICPDCLQGTNIREPFLSVPLPIKEPKQALEEYEYVVVESWKKYRKGTIFISADWKKVTKELAISQEMRRMVGVEGTELVTVSNQLTLLEISSKHPKEEIVFYPPTISPAEEEIDIQVGLAYTHNQAKTPYGYPLFVRVHLSKSLYEVYMELIQILGVDEEVRHQVEQFVAQSAQRFEQATSEKATTRLDSEITQAFEDRFRELLNFELLIVSNKRAKKACVYCHRRCGWCVLPFSFLNTVEDYVSLGQKPLRLEIVFLHKQELQILEKPPQQKADDIATLQECINLFNEPEILDEQNFWFCTLCEAPKLATKVLSICKKPNILVFQLKRFKEHGGHKIKNNEPMDDTIYRFNSAIIHEGSLEGGHYWAICRKKEDYFTLNDDSCKQRTDLFSPNAYVLFYERI